MQIYTNEHGNSSCRQLKVPLPVYQTLEKHQQLRSQLVETPVADHTIYVSISVAGNNGKQQTCCVARVDACEHLDKQKDDEQQQQQYLCSVGNDIWQLLLSNGYATLEDTRTAVSLEVITPMELTEIVLGVAAASYEQALAEKGQIFEWLNDQEEKNSLYFQGRISSFKSISRGNTLDLNCLMCMPVSQGLLTKTAHPRIILVKMHDTQPGSNSDNTVPKGPLAEQWNLGAEWFILGENPTSPLGIGESDSLYNLLAADAGKDLSLLSVSDRGEEGIELDAVEMTTSIDSSKMVPDAYAGEDTDNRGYMSLEALAAAGILSGSWVAVAPVIDGKMGDSQRAMRVFGTDRMIQPGHLQTLALPPILFHNVFQTIPLSCKIRLTPLGSPPETPSPAYIKRIAALGYKDKKTVLVQQQPPLEIAKKISIARVLSPLSEKRDLECHALDALQKWLSPQKGNSQILRVVKPGDLIVVHVSVYEATIRTSVSRAYGAENAARIQQEGDNAEIDPNHIDIDPVTDLTFDSNAKDQGSRVLSSELVFYKIVSAIRFTGEYDSDSEYESDGDEDEDEDGEEYDYEYTFAGGSNNGNVRLDSSWAQWYRRVRNRGMVIWPDVTMAVQSGSVHSPVPYLPLVRYLNAQSKVGGPLVCMMTADQPAVIPYSNVLDQLLQLAKASLHPLAKTHNLTCAALVKGNPGTGKSQLVHTFADILGIHLYELSCFDILSDSEEKTAQILQMYFENTRRYTPCVLYLKHIEALTHSSNINSRPDQEDKDDELPISRVLKDCIDNLTATLRDIGYPIVLVASCSQPDKVPSSLAAAFRHELELSAPDESTRLLLLQSIAMDAGLKLGADADIAYISQQTASFVARDLSVLLKRAEVRAWKRVLANSSSSQLSTRDASLAGLAITNEDLLGALGDSRASMSDALGVPKIPNVKWDDVGGLADAKNDILDTIRLPMEQPHLFASGMSTRSGLLFYGPPGTGKTLLAKAIATECGLNFFSCKGPELISPYIGESEANVRRIFQRAREASPCVIFFDELDSLAPKRGQQGDSGGVMDRIVSQLLAELDGMSSNNSNDVADEVVENSKDNENATTSPAVQTFAIGATNRPDLLDPALLRPGRFDKLVYLGVSDTHDAQLNIIQALTRKFHLHPDLDLRQVADKCPFHYTGADFYALCSDALLKAMLRTVDMVDQKIKQWNEQVDVDVEGVVGEEGVKHPVPMTPQYYLEHIAEDSEKDALVTLGDFEQALDELIPSVSAGELVRYQELRRQFDSSMDKAKNDKSKGKGKESNV